MSLLLVVFLVAFLGWLFRPGRRRSAEQVEAVDREELDVAEREVRDLGLHQDPEAGWEGDDWGPGAPRQ
ncbi:MAG TPA: hypothetical protein VMG41_12370 [Gemmatimonadales bacterium]|nr:hypothetical protein [Gemmatimonadales bacterium]